MSPLIDAIEIKKNIALVTLAGAGEDEGDVPCSLPIDSVVLHHLRAGRDVPEEEWKTILKEGQRMLAVRHALALLAARQRTERGLRENLAKRFPEGAVDAAVERMRALGYINDHAWARGYASTSRAAERGSALLRHELRAHVPDEAATAAVAEHDDLAAARTAALKRARSLRKTEEPARSRKLYEFLRRRGFGDGVSRTAMREALAPAEVTEGDGE